MKQLICLVISAIFLHACQKEDENIGLSSGLDRIAILDTSITLKTYTVKGRDHFETGQARRLLVGKWMQGDSLTSTCKTYFQLRLAQESIDYGQNIVCDSIVMYLDYSFYYGDTTAAQDFEVYQLTDFFEESTDSSYLNTDELGVNSTNLSTTTVQGIKPHTDETLKLYLNTSFGKELLDSASGKDNDTFINNTFPGLNLQAKNTSGRGYVFGFAPLSSETKVIAYYTSDIQADVDSVTFTLFGSRRFNNISSYYGSGVPAVLQNLSAATVGEEVSSSETNEICHFQAGSVFYTKVAFTTLEEYLDNLTQNFSDVIIDDASLIVYTSEEINSDDSESPVNFASLYEDDNIDGDDNNDLILQNNETDPLNTTISSSLIALYDDSVTFAYNFNITNYVKSLKNDVKDQYSLLLGASVGNTIFERDKNSINSSRVFSENAVHGAKAMQFRLTYSYSLKN